MTMPNLVKIHHDGYSGGQSASTAYDVVREGDPEIVQLFNIYTGPANPSMTWDFRKEVIQAAMRLLGGNKNWFMRQDANPLVVEYNYQFVLDTVRFISTGRRKISIYAWPDLLSYHSEGALPKVAERREVATLFRELGLTTPIADLIQQWCSHRGGFDDMMYTLNLLFGEVKVKVHHAALGGLR